MKQNNLHPSIKKQLEKLVDEDKKLQSVNETIKKRFSQEIKKFKPNDIRNSIFEEKKPTLWQRIMKTLGMN